MSRFWDSSAVRPRLSSPAAGLVGAGACCCHRAGGDLGPLAGFVFGIAAKRLVLGRRTRGRRGPWVLSILVNVIAVIALLASGFAASGDPPRSSRSPMAALDRPRVTRARGRDPDHEHLPVRRAGAAVVRRPAYDQNGRPITTVSNYSEDGEVIDRTYPVEPNGLRVRNAYPQELTIVDKFGGPTRIPAVPPTRSSHPHRHHHRAEAWSAPPG